MRTWNIVNRSFTLDRPVVVGILNVTPDSFADGGHYMLLENAVVAAERMCDSGAGMIDIGGESTRPGSQPVDADEQIRRVVPVIRALRDRGIAIPISVDTTSARVAAQALGAGADAINDVSAGRDDADMYKLAAATGRYAVTPKYHDVVEDVRTMLENTAASAVQAGVEADRIVLDPGLGFGKSVEDNLRLIDGTNRLAELGFPVMSALSRKSFVGRWHLQRDSSPDERLEGTLLLSKRHRNFGATIFRVHDVLPHVELFKR